MASMNRRQRMLAIAGAIVVGGAALYQFGAWAFYRPLQKLNSDLQAVQSRKEHLLALLKNQQDALGEWRDWYGRALHERDTEAELRFREDLAQLLEKHGLREGLSLSPGAKRTATNGFVEVPFTVNVVGTFEELVSFLVDFYQRPYLARIRDLTLISEDTGLNPKRTAGAAASEAARSGGSAGRGGRAGGRAGRNGASSPGAAPAASAGGHVEAKDARLRITLTAVALVLPPISTMKADRKPLAELLPALKDFKPTVLPHVPEEWPTVKRLSRDASELSGVMNTYVFTKFVPKPEVVVQKPTETQPVAKVDTPPPTLPPPVRPNADKQFVIASVSLNGQPAVLVRDDSAGGATRRYAIEEPVDDGTVILIDPTGMVVRVPHKPAPGQPADAEAGHEDYFYPLGKSFRDRQPFQPELHAELARQLRRSGRI